MRSRMFTSMQEFQLPKIKIKHMRKLIIGFLAVGLFACNSGKNDKTETTKKDTTVSIPDNSATTTQQDTTKKEVTLVFKSYEEGDYPHLIFSDATSNEEYDFGHPTQNSLGIEDVVKENPNTAFGFEINKARVGQKYQATLERKLVDTHDDNGQPKKDYRWRIVSIRKS